MDSSEQENNDIVMAYSQDCEVTDPTKDATHSYEDSPDVNYNCSSLFDDPMDEQNIIEATNDRCIEIFCPDSGHYLMKRDFVKEINDHNPMEEDFK